MEAGKSIEITSEQEKCLTKQQMIFVDADAGHTYTVPSQPDLTYRMGASGERTDIAEWLSRPLQINSFSWNEGSAFGTSFTPWADYFNSPTVRRKLANYARVRAKLKVKIVVNASPAYYGIALASYEPLPLFGGGHTPIVLGTDYHVVSRSQRPHIWIKPTTSQGGCLCLPFFYHKNWLDVNKETDFEQMGTLSIESLGTLRNASGVTGSNITISVFAWAEEVELSQTTADFVAQSGVADSFGKGPISSVASAIGGVAGRLRDVPIIAPFARATEIGANAIAGMASIFGYSRTPTIAPPSLMKNQPFTSFASTGLGETVERIVMDPKQGLTIDSRTVGLDGTDEMTIQSIVTRESYLTKFEWVESAAANDRLWQTVVTPDLFVYDLSSNAVYNTPMAYMGIPFDYWSGDIIFRFQVVASAYHRGRMVVQWDPVEIPNDLIGNSNVRTTQVIDIATTRDFEFQVPYAGTTAFLKLLDQAMVPHFGPGDDIIGYSSGAFNGGLSVSVQNSLTSLSGSSDISIIVSVRAADNMKYAKPAEFPPNMHLTAQSGIASPDDHASLEGAPIGSAPLEVMPGLDVDEHIFKVYQGEQYLSIRDLMKRYTRIFGLGTPETAGSYSLNTVYGVLPRMPPVSGGDPNGMFEDSDTNRQNYVGNCPLTFFKNCYIGYRGGIRWRMNTLGVTPPELAITRSDLFRNSNNIASVTSIAIGDSTSLIGWYSSSRPSGFAGTMVTNGRTQMGLEVELPMYSLYRMLSTSNQSSFLGQTFDDSDEDSFMYHIVNDVRQPDRAIMQFYAAAADDFSLFFFLNVPAIYYYSQLTPL